MYYVLTFHAKQDMRPEVARTRRTGDLPYRPGHTRGTVRGPVGPIGMIIGDVPSSGSSHPTHLSATVR